MNQLQHHARICKRCIVLLETVVMATLLPAVAIVSQSAQAQTFTTLHSFDRRDGSGRYAGLLQATNGALYGTTAFGGLYNSGTVFKMTPSGTLTTLYNFCPESGCTDGALPALGLVQGSAGEFYGTTSQGGAYGQGTVFKISPTGTLTTLHSFAGTDGNYPAAVLVQGSDGKFYGTTVNGGANESCDFFGINGCGTVFSITSAGVLTTIYNFCSQ